MKSPLHQLAQDRLRKSAGSLLVANSLRKAPRAALAAWRAAGGNVVFAAALFDQLREGQAHITAMNTAPAAPAGRR